MISRRKLLSTSVLGGAALVAGCTTSTDPNGVKTVTLNVAAADAWGQALLNSVGLLVVLPGIAGTPAALAIAAVKPMIAADIAAFDKAANGKLTFTFDPTSTSTGFNSLLTDAGTLLNDVQAAVPQATGAAAQTAQEYLAAITTIVSLIKAAASTTAAAPASGMSEAQALNVLGVAK